YMIAHVLYRNKKFAHSVGYLAELNACLQTEGKMHYAEFFPRYTFLMVANQVFLRNNEEAVALMEKLLYKSIIHLTHRDQLTAQLGLSFNYFAQGAFGKANRVLLGIKRSDKWLERTMGREWVLKKKMGELILQYELGNEDLVLNRIRAFERTFKDLLQQPAYYNVKQYLELIRHIVDNPDVVAGEAF